MNNRHTTNGVIVMKCGRNFLLAMSIILGGMSHQSKAGFLETGHSIGAAVGLCGAAMILSHAGIKLSLAPLIASLAGGFLLEKKCLKGSTTHYYSENFEEWRTLKHPSLSNGIPGLLTAAGTMITAYGITRWAK